MPNQSFARANKADLAHSRFEALHQVSQRLQGMRGDSSIAQEALGILEEYVGFENGAVLLIDHSTGLLTPFALSDHHQGSRFVDLDREFVAAFKPAVGRGITGWVAETGTSVRLDDVTVDARYLAVREDIRSELCVPIRVGEKLIGVVNVESTRVGAYDADDQRLLEIFATQIGLAIRLDGIRREAKLVTTHVDAMVAERTREISTENVTLQRMVTIDALTEIGNRRGFDSVLALELRRASRTDMPISLLLMDIDCFKAYNDGYGHVAGDACLKRLAKNLAVSISRAGDYLARYGGEEFAIILPNTDATHSKQVAERIQERLAAENIAHAYSTVAPTLTISIGMATVQLRNRVVSQADIINLADKALYEAKTAGRNRIVQVTA